MIMPVTSATTIYVHKTSHTPLLICSAHIDTGTLTWPTPLQTHTLGRASVEIPAHKTAHASLPIYSAQNDAGTLARNSA